MMPRAQAKELTQLITNSSVSHSDADVLEYQELAGDIITVKTSLPICGPNKTAQTPAPAAILHKGSKYKQRKI